MPSPGIIIKGNISAEEVAKALKSFFPDRIIDITSNSTDFQNKQQLNNDSIVIADCENTNTLSLIADIEEKNNQISNLENSSAKAVQALQKYDTQQKALYDEFVLLRQKYDDQKNSLLNILWIHCCTYHPDLREIPDMEDEDTYVENDIQVGHIYIGETLGEGQFALVKSCTKDGSPKVYALKIIKKERITTFTSLLRVSTEIKILKQLNSEYIISVSEVIQTSTKLYIVTEKGGLDLFEFFDEHPNGVPESWAREICSNILKAVLYCHEKGICHRDLKPENILISFDSATGKCQDLKLCDFGLGTHYDPKVMLTDFCGSPGFFAPEMIIHGSYFGNKADIWSIGCIILELILGHERFCDVWMVSYDYEVLQDKATFTESMQETLSNLPQALNFSEDLNNFVLRFLQLKSTLRPPIRTLSSDPWLMGTLDEELAQLRAAKLSISQTAPLSPSTSYDNHLNSLSSPSGLIVNNKVDTELLKLAFSNLSDREKRQMQEYLSTHSQKKHVETLPPIEPATPNVSHARKILNKGDESVTKGHSRQFFATSPTPDSYSPSTSHLITTKSQHIILPGLLESTKEDVVVTESPVLLTSNSEHGITLK